MRLKKPRCPECEVMAIHAVDWCPGAAGLSHLGDFEFDWSGETEFFYDGQLNEIDIEILFGSRPASDCDKMLVGCGMHEWITEVE